MSGLARRPGFLRGENQDRRKPNGNSAEDVLNRLQGAAPPDAGRRVAIERILADVEVEG